MTFNLNKIIPEIETRSQNEIKAFQNEKLKTHLQYIAAKSKFYQELFEKNKINISKIRSIDDLTHIPPTSKADLNERNNDFICVKPEKIVDYVTTSGTLGDPVIFVLTNRDLDRLAYNEAISFGSADIGKNDIIQLTTTIDKRFMAGLAYFLGARKLGAGIIRVGGGIPELQWDSINRISPNVLIAIPSFILRIVEYAEKNGIDYKNSSIKKAICIGEALHKPDLSLSTLAKKIKEKWDIHLYSTYASTEMGTAFTECKYGVGGHHHPELIIVEFLDENGQPVPEGQPGEVTITTLQVEGMPLLRFKTGDICIHYNEPCKCGRTTTRLGPVIGRRKQMIKFKGTTLYPPALYDILDHIDEVENYIVEVFTNKIGTDELLVRVGCKHYHDKLEKEIKDRFRAKLRVAPTIVFDMVENINKTKFPETSRKPNIFIDNRTKT